MDTYKSERTFFLKSLAVRLIKCWYWILGAMAAGMIVTPVFQFINLIKTYKKNLAAFEAGSKNAAEPQFPAFPFAHILIGAVLGCLLACLVIWLIYYVDNHLKCSSELNKPRETELFATYKTLKDTKTEVFAKKLIKYPEPVPEEKMASLLCARLVAVCKNRDIHSIVFAGNIGQREKTILIHIVETLQKVGVSTEWTGNILTEPEAILGLKAGVGVVLAEQVGKATYSAIDDEIAVCLHNRTELLGFVAFE